MSATNHANKYDTSSTKEIIRSSPRQDSVQALYRLSAENPCLSWIK